METKSLAAGAISTCYTMPDAFARYFESITFATVSHKRVIVRCHVPVHDSDCTDNACCKCLSLVNFVTRETVVADTRDRYQMDEPLPEDEAYKFGIQYEPPSLVYVYRDKYTKKLTRYMMPVRNFTLDSDYKLVSLEIKERHKEKLKPIAVDKIETALRLLISYLKSSNENKHLRNRRLFHVGPKIKSPQNPCFKRVKVNGNSEGYGQSECMTDSQEENDMTS